MTACGACPPTFPACPFGAPCRPGASRGPDATDPPIVLPTLDQLRARPGHVTLDDRRPAAMPPTCPPAEADPVLRAALAIRAALERHGVQPDAGALLAAAEAAVTELERVGDHVHHWQAWREQQHPHVFVDTCDAALAGCPVHVGAAA